ncbi:MAG: endonuclease [Marinoscillum sp.]
MIKAILAHSAVLMILPALMAQSIPDGYYDAANGLTGEELKAALNDIVKGHDEFPYTSSGTDTWDILKESDQDPTNSANVIGLYSGFSMDAEAEYNGGDGWTREHVWAKSRGDFGTELGAGTDVHHLRPEDNSTNSARSNRTFGECNVLYVDDQGTYQGSTGSYTSSSDFVWEPRAAVKGDVARMIFYMATRYEGEDGEPDLEIVDYVVEQFSSLPEHGKLTDLLIWHREDPVDDFEINRNEVIFGYQKNRNPFIDHPEYVGQIWGEASDPFIDLDRNGFSPDFGIVVQGESFVQSYFVNAYNLSENVSVSVEAPFQLSLDGENFSNAQTLVHAEGSITQSFRVYLKFEPQDGDGEIYESVVSHTASNIETVNLTVTGEEGEAKTISIAEARQKPLGTVVEITGVIIGGENNSSSSRVLYDGTAGIVIRSPDGEPNETGSLIIGDSVIVSGALSDYNNLLQVNETPMTVTLLAQSVNLPQPKELTISGVNENYESQLVIIKGVTFEDAGARFDGGGSDGNFNISDETGTLVYRIGNPGHPLVGVTIPSGKIDVTGFIGQFGSDYQLSPRNLTDLAEEDGGSDEDLEVMSIADVRSQKKEGDRVKVKGIVIGGPTNNSLNRVIFDGTAGLVVRSGDVTNFTGSLELGDSVIVSGELLDYNGLLEIEGTPIVKLLNKENELPNYQPILLENLGEEFESELIELVDLKILESGKFQVGNYTLSDGTVEASFRIGSNDHPLIGSDIPKVMITVKGYLGQSNNDYEIFVNGSEDLVLNPITLSASQNSSFVIYPNPTTENISFNGLKTNVVTISIFDNKGVKIFNKKIESDRVVNVDELKPGIYLVTVETSEKIFSSQLIMK